MIEVINECAMKCDEEQRKAVLLAWGRLLNVIFKGMRAGYDGRRRREGIRMPKEDRAVSVSCVNCASVVLQ